jgi:large subunit ribosomal protein L21
MSYAIIQTGGKQYRVTEGDILDVEKLPLEPGQSTTFTNILMVADGEEIKVGAPFVDKASVNAEVVDQWKGEKVIAFKFRRRKGYHRTVGHRRQLTKLKITSIATQ